MEYFSRSTNALEFKSSTGADLTLSDHGSDWLWAVTAVYIIAFFVCLVPTFTTPDNKRVFHLLFSATLLFASVTYFAQAADLGWSAVEEGDQLTRQIFYARYINWVISFPTVALALGLLSGISWTTIVINVVVSWYWVLTYLAAAYTTTAYKWGFFAFGTFAYIIFAMSLINECRESAAAIGIGRDYVILAGWANLIFLLYPIAFALTDGANIIGVTDGFIFVGALDLLLLPVVGIGFIFMSSRWDFARLQLDFSDYRGVRHQQSQHGTLFRHDEDHTDAKPDSPAA